jgi:hypothetical protein
MKRHERSQEKNNFKKKITEGINNYKTSTPEALFLKKVILGFEPLEIGPEIFDEISWDISKLSNQGLLVTCRN